MKVILTKDIDNIGRERDVKDVSDGYARNFLFPQKLAIIASDTALKDLENSKTRFDKKIEQKLGEMKKLAGKIADCKVSICADAGEEGKLFGSVTNADIAQELGKSGIEIDRKKIVLSNPIRTVGEHVVKVKVFRDVEADLTVSVTAKQ